MSLKTIAKELLPNAVLRLLRRWRRALSPSSYHAFRGNYPDWAAAMQDAGGYAEEAILQQVLAAALKVKNGEAAFERDGVVFDEITYSYPLLASLLLSAANDRDEFCVVDVGGALGSTYSQHRRLLPEKTAAWHIVEQPNYVKVGCEQFADETLHFHPALDDIPETPVPDAFLFSGVLQYLKDSIGMLQATAQRAPRHIIIDRTPLISATASPRIVVQHVARQVMPASYPCRLLSAEDLRQALPDYEELCSWACDEHIPWDGGEVCYRGFLFRRHG